MVAVRNSGRSIHEGNYSKLPDTKPKTEEDNT